MSDRDLRGGSNIELGECALGRRVDMGKCGT